MRFALALLLSIAAVTATAQQRATTRIFVSGHSLTDNPMPPFLAQIAQSLGDPVLWNRQYIVGSAIKYRTRGRDKETGWAGYAMGWNRDTREMNVLDELRQPKTTDGKPYDTLIITEQHGVLDSLVWHDTIRFLRHYHERFIEANSRGQTVFYEPWLGLPDKNDPRRWIAYERAASPVWQCIVTRINTSLAAEGRADRLASLPVGVALAELVERATQGAGLPGLSAANVRATVDLLFHDNVHLTKLGAYYAALVTYAGTFNRSPVGAWAPEDVNAAQAAVLQRVAWEAVSRLRSENKPLTLTQCQALIDGPFKALYFDHMRDDYWAKQPGNALGVTYKRLKHTARTRWLLSKEDVFRYDPATDREYWLPAP